MESDKSSLKSGLFNEDEMQEIEDYSNISDNKYRDKGMEILISDQLDSLSSDFLKNITSRNKKCVNAIKKREQIRKLIKELLEYQLDNLKSHSEFTSFFHEKIYEIISDNESLYNVFKKTNNEGLDKVFKKIDYIFDMFNYKENRSRYFIDVVGYNTSGYVFTAMREICDLLLGESDDTEKVKDFFFKINEETTNRRKHKYYCSNHSYKTKTDGDKKKEKHNNVEQLADNEVLKKQGIDINVLKENFNKSLKSLGGEDLKGVFLAFAKSYTAGVVTMRYCNNIEQIKRKFQNNGKIFETTEVVKKINPSDVEKYDIIRIESCDATKKFDNPEGYRKIGIVVNKDKDRIDCLLLNSHDGAGHYPNMQVNGESIKINNKDFFLSDLPFDMQNEFGNDKLISYISRDTYTLSDNDKNNMYCCGFLDDNNKIHADLIKKIIAATVEGIKSGYDDEGDFEGQMTYRSLNDCVGDFTGYRKVTSFFKKIDDLLKVINIKDNNTQEDKKEEDKKEDTKQEDVKEDIKQEDVKEENNVINLNSIDGINLINKPNEEVNNNAMGNNIKGFDEEEPKNNEIKRKRKHKKKKKTKDSNIQADKKEDIKQEDVKEESSSADKNNNVAKINTENANNTNSINFK